MGISIGDAILHLRTSDEGLQSGLSSAGSSITTWATRMGAAIAGAVTVAKIAQALRQTVEETVAYATEVRQLSSVTGQTTEASSRLLQVFEDFEVQGGQVTMMLRTLASQGLSPTIETIAALSDRYLALAPGVERATFLQDNFGRSGADLAIVMEQGSAALLARNAGVERGLVLSQTSVDAAEDLRQAEDALGDSWKSLATVVALQFIPTIAEATTALARILIPTEDLRAGIQNLNLGVARQARTYSQYVVDATAAAEAAHLMVFATQEEYDAFWEGRTGWAIRRNYIILDTEAQYDAILASEHWNRAEEARLQRLREGSQLYDANAEAAAEYGRTVANLPSAYSLSIVADVSGDLARIGDELRMHDSDIAQWAQRAGQLFAAQYAAGMLAGDPEAAAETADLLAGIQHDEYLRATGATAGDRRRALLDLGWTPAEVAAYMASPFAYIQAYFDAHPIQLTFVGGPSGVPGAPIRNWPKPPVDEKQHGGAWTVGGEGGTDRNLVQFMATRGEHVEVTPRGEQAAGKTINIGPINVYSRDDEAEFVQLLISAFRGV